MTRKLKGNFEPFVAGWTRKEEKEKQKQKMQGDTRGRIPMSLRCCDAPILQNNVILLSTDFHDLWEDISAFRSAAAGIEILLEEVLSKKM
jgi:hypothetical protein